MPRRRPDAGRPVIRAEVEARLARKIRISAATRRRCPKKGCRRAGKCRNFDRCAGVPREPIVFSEAEDRAFRTALKTALARARGAPGNAGGYDPDARDRDRPMPPAPARR